MAVQQDQESAVEEKVEETLEMRNAKMGVDVEFQPNKHMCILQFPWNLGEAAQAVEFSPLADSNFWVKFMKNQGFLDDFNQMYREFHQYCAIPDYRGLEYLLEPNLFESVTRSIEEIRMNGLALEMANLVVNQPRIDILKVEIHENLKVDRRLNMGEEDYNISKSRTFGGADHYLYKNKEGDTRHIMDAFEEHNKPYLLSVTTQVESPMKFFVYNQNRSGVLFGSNDNEMAQNLVKFEINISGWNMLRLLPVGNKPRLLRDWRITDINNVLNENPYFA